TLWLQSLPDAALSSAKGVWKQLRNGNKVGSPLSTTGGALFSLPRMGNSDGTSGLRPLVDYHFGNGMAGPKTEECSVGRPAAPRGHCSGSSKAAQPSRTRLLYIDFALPPAEKALIAHIRRRAGKGSGIVAGIGDDCAILQLPVGHEVLLTTDFTL